MARRYVTTKNTDPPRIDPAFARLVKIFASDHRVTYGGKGFGSSGLKVNGKIFAMLSSKGDFVVKLPRDRVAELVGLGRGSFFDPGHGRQMKEWIVISGATASWVKLAKDACAFVGTVGK